MNIEITISKVESINCPFCDKVDFNKVGLKEHFISGNCKIYNITISIKQEKLDIIEMLRFTKEDDE